MPRAIDPLVLSPDQRSELQGWVVALGTPQQVALRCRIILAVAAGNTEMMIAAENGVNRKTVRLWRERFRSNGPQALWDIAPGRGRKPTYDVTRIKALIDTTLQTKPKGTTHWSCRTMSAAQGISKSSVSRIWRSHHIKPHLTKPFKLSRDPKFLEKLTDVIGLYLNPPDRAIVLCVDEKSQIQALQRTQPGLPLKKGRCGTMTHDYKRHGTTTLFAALDVLAGKVIGDCYKRHRHQEFLRFLRRINREFPGNSPLHLVMDNYGTHGTPEVKDWLNRHPRFTVHYAFCSRCLQPRYFSVVWTETWPSKIGFGRDPLRHRGTGGRMSAGDHAARDSRMPALLAQYFTTCHTTRSVTPLPQALPARQTHRNTRPSLMSPDVSQESMRSFDPVRNRNRSNVPALANQIHDGPVILPPLEMSNVEFCRLFPPQPATQEEAEKSPVSFALESIRVGHLPERSCLVGSEPITQTNSEVLRPFDPPDTGSEIQS